SRRPPPAPWPAACARRRRPGPSRRPGSSPCRERRRPRASAAWPASARRCGPRTGLARPPPGRDRPCAPGPRGRRSADPWRAAPPRCGRWRRRPRRPEQTAPGGAARPAAPVAPPPRSPARPPSCPTGVTRTVRVRPGRRRGRQALVSSMAPLDVTLSVLDLAPVGEGTTPADALRASLRLVQDAERLGYHRYWVAEHHNMPGIASSAPAVLLAHLASVTERIRL